MTFLLVQTYQNYQQFLEILSIRAAVKAHKNPKLFSTIGV